MLSILLDIEWLLSTLFDASLLTFEPPETAAPFFVVSCFVPVLSRFRPLRGNPSGQDLIPGQWLFETALPQASQPVQHVDLAVSVRENPSLRGAAATAKAWPRSNYVQIFGVEVLDIRAQAAQCWTSRVGAGT